MDVSLWADIRRLTEVEGLSQCAISRQLHCSRRTIKKALAASTPPGTVAVPRTSILDPYRTRIDALIQQHPEISAVRVHEEISRGPEGYRGCVRLVRSYVSRIRPHRSRVYQEVHYEAGQAVQVDWGNCGSIQIGRTKRSVSVFVAVLCYSRLLYIEFTLTQKKAEFYRAIANAMAFFGGSPQQIIFDNLKAAVISGSGRHACLHPEFVALCGHFLMQPIACERRDPESKGVVEAAVRFVKRNALEGRREQLASWNDYMQFAPHWRDQVANVRMHEQHGCAVLVGKTGTGKSHLLNALGHTACEKTFSVRWTRVVDMINDLTKAQINGTLGKALREFTRPELLLLDELGYLPVDKRGADLLFQVVATRYETGSIVVSTNRPFRAWGTIFDADNTLATALIDRLMHHGEALVIEGESYRTHDKSSDCQP
jgi:DNA replication protein DnaC